MGNIFQIILAYIIARLREPSTYRGLAALAGAAGIAVDPASTQQILGAVLGLMGAVGLLPDTVGPRAGDPS